MGDRENDMYIDNSDEQICLMCEKKISDKDYPKILEKALSRKHCANLNQLYYAKDINKILNNERVRATIEVKEWEADQPDNEYIKKMYNIEEFKGKHERLMTYYQHHPTKPKVYIKEVSETVRKYYYYQDKLKNDRVRPAFTDEETSSQPVVILVYSVQPKWRK